MTVELCTCAARVCGEQTLAVCLRAAGMAVLGPEENGHPFQAAGGGVHWLSGRGRLVAPEMERDFAWSGRLRVIQG